MAFNLNNAVQGAQIGGQLGGGWGAVAGGVLGLLSGDGGAAKAAKEYNDKVVKHAAEDLFDLRRQQNVQNMRTARTLANYAVQNKTAQSTITANLGAADIIGSSAQALKQTMDFQTQQAKADTMLNWETDVDNYNRAVDTMTSQRMNSLQRSTGQEVDVGALAGNAFKLYQSSQSGFQDIFGLTPERATPTPATTTLMDSMKYVWEGGTGTGLQVDNLNPAMRTFAL